MHDCRLIHANTAYFHSNLADMGFQEVPVFEGVYENVRVM
jgi:hypothetical protein